MKNKIIIVITTLLVLILTSLSIYLLVDYHNKKLSDKSLEESNKIHQENTLKLQEEYESLNNNPDLKQVNIPDNTPFIYITISDILTKITNQDNFLLYFGSNTDNYTRSTITYLIYSANTANISTIYYIDITNLDTTIINSEKYTQLQELIGSTNFSTPMLISIIKGKVESTNSIISEKFTSPTMELTPEIIDDTKNILETFITNYLTLSSTCPIDQNTGC